MTEQERELTEKLRGTLDDHAKIMYPRCEVQIRFGSIYKVHDYWWSKVTFIKPCDYEQERQFEVEHKYDYFYDHKDDTWGPAKNGEFK